MILSQTLTDSLPSCSPGSLLAWMDVETIDTSLSQQILQSFHDPQKMEVMSSTDKAKIWNECKVRRVDGRKEGKKERDTHIYKSVLPCVRVPR